MGHLNIARSALLVLANIVLLLLLCDCGGKSMPIRHLSSDVCLVMPDSTTRREVLSFLGPPDKKLTSPGGQETWLYLDVKKSLMRNMPVVGDSLGSQHYETVLVSFEADLVRTCMYRHFNEQELEEYFRDIGITVEDK